MLKLPTHLPPLFPKNPVRTVLTSLAQGGKLLCLSLVLLSTFSWAAPSTLAASKPPQTVLVSIKPVALIVKALVPDNSEVNILLPASASPHDYHLKPSDIRHIKSANSVIWVGPDIEPYLAKALLTHQTAANTLQLHQQEQALNFESTEQDHNEHSSHESKDDDGHHHDHGHEHEGEDPHLWLSPDKAKLMATQISHWLSTQDPAQEATYEKKLTQFLEQLEVTDKQIRTLLEPVHEYGYVVFHDAYSGFETHYGLNHLNALTLNPEQTASAQRLAKVRDQLSHSQARCLFSEPQFNASSISAITQGLDIRHGILDPMATNINVTADGYFEFLQQLAKQFHNCLYSEPALP